MLTKSMPLPTPPAVVPDRESSQEARRRHPRLGALLAELQEKERERVDRARVEALAALRALQAFD